MALGGNKSGGSVYLGLQLGHSVVRFSASPAFILGKCGRCGAQKECTRLAFDAGMSTLNGEFHCDCGTRVRLSVPLVFRKSGF
jgi:hypothetical protein